MIQTRTSEEMLSLTAVVTDRSWLLGASVRRAELRNFGLAPVPGAWDISVPLLSGDHIKRRHGRVFSQTHMDLAEMEQAARQQAQVEERRKAASLSRAEFERLTPGFPYPPAPSQKPIAGMLFKMRLARCHSLLKSE
jgi:hypothetical protein